MILKEFWAMRTINGQGETLDELRTDLQRVRHSGGLDRLDANELCSQAARGQGTPSASDLARCASVGPITSFTTPIDAAQLSHSTGPETSRQHSAEDYARRRDD